MLYSCDHRILLWDVRKARSCVASLDQHNGKKASNVPHLGYCSPLLSVYVSVRMSVSVRVSVCLSVCLF